MKVLILGGYGTFGSRLIRLLADEPRLTLIAAGRSHEKAEAFLSTLTAKATLQAASVDRNGDLSASLARLAPDVIVDATGPFQTYGEKPYRVVEAAIAVGADYLDLADGAAFVDGIATFDEQAKARGVAVISGASTFPALSAAVVRHLTDGWQRVEALETGLAPSPKAGLGRSVIAAILSYAGKPVPVLSDGEQTTAPGLIDSRRATIAAPGVEPMPPLHFRLIDLPDQRLFQSIWPELQSMWAGVATRPQFAQHGLAWTSRLVQVKLLRSLSFLTGPALWTMRKLPFGAHRGGLYLKVTGQDASGAPIAKSWHMIAEGDDGPFVPAIAAASLLRRRLEGPLSPGARAATREVTLADYEATFDSLSISSGTHDETSAPLYHAVLGSAWHDLPGPIRDLHTAPNGKTVRGTATVERGTNPLARLIARIVGFPKAGEAIPVEVSFSEQDGGELWQRSFDGNRFESFQKQGTGAFAHLISESFGPLEFGLALVVRDDKLWLITKGWRAFGIPMPRFLAPSGDAFEHVEDGRFHFHVEIRHWMTGLIVRYRGHLSTNDHSGGTS